jgi:hypothetical protein
MAPPAKKPKLSKGNRKDECWKYTIDFPGRGRNQTKCLFCKVINSGGINRFKYHVAGIRGHDTEPCKDAPPEAKRTCYVALEKYEQEKELRQKQLAELAQIGSPGTSSSRPPPSRTASVSSFTPLGSIGCVGEGSSRPSYRPSASASASASTSIPTSAAVPDSSTGITFRPRVRKSRLDNYFVPRSTPGAQPSLESLAWNREIHEAGRRAICKFWFFCNIPFIAAR